jgi:hypothetical protein
MNEGVPNRADKIDMMDKRVWEEWDVQNTVGDGGVGNDGPGL